KIVFKEGLLSTIGIDQAVESGKPKIKKNKITLSNKEFKLELIGSISKKKNKPDGKIKTINLFDDGNLILTADNYNIKVKDFLKAQKALKDGDFQPLNALFFSGPLVFKGS